MKPKKWMTTMLMAATAISTHGAPSETPVYKSTDQGELKMHIFNPAGHQASDRRPAIVFFFGGGWMNGAAGQFYQQAQALADRGMVAMCADYRVFRQHDTAPAVCVQDAKSAMRWMRSHANELGIDPERIAAAGGSAGGHLAAATAWVKGFDEPGEDLSVSCKPQALVLFNPVVDTSPDGYGGHRVLEYGLDFSPLHNITGDNPPPTLFMLGTQDQLIPVETGRAFARRMEVAGGTCQLVLYEGMPHGFFNKARYEETLQEMVNFLVGLGWIEAQAMPNASSEPRN